MRKAILAVALTAAVSLAVPVSSSAWAADPLPTRGGPTPSSEAGRTVADHGLTVIGLTTGQHLVRFTVDRPAKPMSIGKVSGLRGDTKIVGIDFRVQNEKLYGVGDKGGIYTLNTTNAKAMKVSQLTVALAGKHFGVDFNPAANRLRVISDTGQNLRHNIDDNAAPSPPSPTARSPTPPHRPPPPAASPPPPTPTTTSTPPPPPPSSTSTPPPTASPCNHPPTPAPSHPPATSASTQAPTPASTSTSPTGPRRTTASRP